MADYISLKDYAKHLDIEKGDIILVSSDAKKLMWDAVMHKADTDLNQLIDSFIEAVGPEGTVIFPTYNWDFCKGVTFDYYKTPCTTGSLGTVALKRDDFKRTKHALYSLAVWGKYQDELVAMDNTDSFSHNSPFEFFYQHNVKNYQIDVTLFQSLTFTHYVEESSGVVNYRFIKHFTADYVDENGEKSTRTYSMLVRRLDNNLVGTIDPIEPDLIEAGAAKHYSINSSDIRLVKLGDAYPVMMKDIMENKSRKLCTYDGQN